MRIKVLTIIAMTIVITMSVAASYDENRPDKKLESKKIIGRLTSYQHADYAHVIVKTEQGSEQFSTLIDLITLANPSLVDKMLFLND